MNQRKAGISLVVMLTAIMVACAPLENQARDAAAALNGTLTAAQTEYQAQCQQDPTLAPCTLINRGISGQNALITATQAYCGWSASSAPAQPDAQCVPIKSAEGGLKTAIANAQQLTTEIGKAVKP
jgi:hypothetical protein